MMRVEINGQEVLVPIHVLQQVRPPPAPPAPHMDCPPTRWP